MELITRFSQDLTRAKYAKSTREHYLTTIQALAERFGKPIEELSRDDLREFVDELHAQARSSSWLTMHLAALLFLYRRTLGRPNDVSFVTWPKKYQRLPDVLTTDEVGALLRAIRVPLYQAIVMLMYGAGLRLSGALALEVGDIEGQRCVVRVRHGKGNKPREITISPALYQWLRSYWAVERPPAPYLFVSRKTGKPPLGETVRAAMQQAAQAAGITKRVHPHVLRHSYATHMLEGGTNLRIVQAQLGHACIKFTARYMRVVKRPVPTIPTPAELLPSNPPQ